MQGGETMASGQYYERIEATFERVEEALEDLPEDPDLSVAEGVINVRFANGVVFVFSRQPPTEQLWLATPGGGFHYLWDEQAEGWRDTKTGEDFDAVLTAQLRDHVGIEFCW